jgi:hypothetical protein
MRVPAWYAPKVRHSFLLVDPDESFLTSLPTGLGTPIASYTIGPIEMPAPRTCSTIGWSPGM